MDTKLDRVASFKCTGSGMNYVPCPLILRHIKLPAFPFILDDINKNFGSGAVSGPAFRMTFRFRVRVRVRVRFVLNMAS